MQYVGLNEEIKTGTYKRDFTRPYMQFSVSRIVYGLGLSIGIDTIGNYIPFLYQLALTTYVTLQHKSTE